MAWYTNTCEPAWISWGWNLVRQFLLPSKRLPRQTLWETFLPYWAFVVFLADFTRNSSNTREAEPDLPWAMPSTTGQPSWGINGEFKREQPVSTSYKGSLIGHFQITFSVFLKARLGFHPFTWMKISFTCKLNSFSYEWLCTRPRFEREAQSSW